MVYHLVSSKHLDHIRSWFDRVAVAKVIGYHQLTQALQPQQQVPRFQGSSVAVPFSQTQRLKPSSHCCWGAHIIQWRWLVVYLPPWKIWRSIGIMTFPIWWGKKKSCSKPPTSISLIYFSDIFWGYLFNLARFWTCLKLGVYPNWWQCLIEKMMINEKFNYNWSHWLDGCKQLCI